MQKISAKDAPAQRKIAAITERLFDAQSRNEETAEWLNSN
jgi:hypothetical protein